MELLRPWRPRWLQIYTASLQTGRGVKGVIPPRPKLLNSQKFLNSPRSYSLYSKLYFRQTDTVICRGRFALKIRQHSFGAHLFSSIAGVCIGLSSCINPPYNTHTHTHIAWLRLGLDWRDYIPRYCCWLSRSHQIIFLDIWVSQHKEKAFSNKQRENSSECSGMKKLCSLSLKEKVIINERPREREGGGGGLVTTNGRPVLSWEGRKNTFR